MAIENWENDTMEPDEIFEIKVPEIKPPVSVEDLEAKFIDPVEISDPTGIEPYFKQNYQEKRLCITLPVTIQDEEKRAKELAGINSGLRKAIFKYFSVDNNSSIGISLNELIGEATSDIPKHTVLREKFEKILVLVTKDNLDLSFHLVNPARADANLTGVNKADSVDEYHDCWHGHGMAQCLEEDLLKNGCRDVKDEARLVKDFNSETVAVERDFSVKLPSVN